MNEPSEPIMDPWDEPEEHWNSDAADLLSPRRATSQVDGFERWLKEGLEGYFWDGLSLEEAFPELAPMLNHSSSLAAAMKMLVMRQDSVRRSDFRQALANLLASPALKTDSKTVPLFAMILHIAVEVEATEIFKPLVSRVREGSWTRLVSDQGTQLFTEAMLTVSRMASPRKDALACINSLIDSIPFQTSPYPFAFTALEALCHCEPEHFLQNMKRLRNQLNAQFAHYSPKPVDMQRAVASLITLVGPKRFLEDLITFLGQDNPFNIETSPDLWLFRAVFSSADEPSPLIDCRESSADKDCELTFHLPEEPLALDFSIPDPLGWSRLRGMLSKNGWISSLLLSNSANDEMVAFFEEESGVNTPMQRKRS
ncbi:MAG: hypothetical protein HQL76_12205 [Magnetococcales bacterium]|nr:hypothetical protein [Magnetococcales bacterium]